MKNQKYSLYEVEPMSNLKEIVNRVAEKFGDAIAFTYGQDSERIDISYHKFKSDINAFENVLFNLGIQNQKIALIGENSYEWIMTYFSVVNSGNVIVPLDQELSLDQIKHILTECGATSFLFSDTYAGIAEQLQNSDISVQHFINLNTVSELLKNIDFNGKGGKRIIANYEIDNMMLATILYTSGTTGKPKGVMLSHKNLAFNATGACQNISFPHSSLLVLPLHHSFAFTAGILMMIISGATIAINQNLKDLKKDIQQFKPRNILMVPLLIETFHKQISIVAKGNNDSKALKKIANVVFGGNLRTIVSGGSPLDKKYIEQFREMGITILEGYGITECSPVVSVNRNQYYRDGSVGQVLPNCEVKILNPNEDGYGEICVKGDTVMLGYYNNHKQTKESFDNRWFKTGDIGTLDKDGFLFISGRKKNLIILANGKNVYPEELEFILLNSISYIKEVIIYAEKELIVAEVFLGIEKENSDVFSEKLNEDILHLNKSLALYKNIGRIIIRDTEFPKTTTKKIKRKND